MAIGLWLAWPAGAGAESASPASAIRAYAASLAAGDAEAALALFAGDATLRLPLPFLADDGSIATPEGTFTGRGQLGAWLRASTAAGDRMDIVGLQEVGETATWTARVSSFDNAPTFGVDPVDYPAQATVRDGLIISLVVRRPPPPLTHVPPLPPDILS